MSSLLVRVSDLTVTDKPYQTLISVNSLFMAVSKLCSKCLIFNFFTCLKDIGFFFLLEDQIIVKDMTSIELAL